MPRCHPPSAIMGPSGTGRSPHNHGDFGRVPRFHMGHACPEAQEGAIALGNRDRISIDAVARTITLDVPKPSGRPSGGWTSRR